MHLEIFYGLLISYFFLFLLSIFLEDNSIVDVFWPIGFLQVFIHSLFLSNTFYLSQFLLLILVLIWSLRLFYYILSKKLNSKKEDIRYAIWRKTWKYFYLRSIFQIYLLQMILLLLISNVFILFNTNPINLNFILIIGFLISLFGLIFESISDYQLFKFITNKKNKGKLMMKGLWKYSRHPNYFGEFIFWLGISIYSFQSSIYSLISVIIIFILLRFVSGVPMAEKRYLKRKDFIEYSKKTPAFFPNFFIK